MACACGNETCGCSAPAVVYLMDELGATHAFMLAERIEVRDRQYVFAVDAEDSDRIALLRIERNPDGSVRYDNIVDDDEWAELEATLGVQ
jgi:hypothetical protein